jgi:hypothetical protein
MGSRKTKASVVVLAVLLAMLASDFLLNRTTIPNASAVETTQDVGIYWDRNCSQAVYSIDWGTLSPGTVKDVVVYARNEGTESYLLGMELNSLSPENVFDYLKFSCVCEDKWIEVGEVVQVTQRLFVSPQTRGISSFSFGILFERGASILGDMNQDRIVNSKDCALFLGAYKGSASPEIMFLADLGSGALPQFFVCDGVVDNTDLLLFLQCYKGLGPNN